MKYDEICLELSKEAAPLVEVWLFEQELSFQLIDDSTLDPPPMGFVRFAMYVEPSVTKDIIASISEQSFHPTVKVDFRTRDDSEWQDAWKRFFHTRKVGRFAIVPSWEEAQYQSIQHQIPIHLDPGRAFGTGGHASTRLCLELMDEDITKACFVLDVGCGCGTLAIAALLANTKARALAIDIDPEAVEVTRENVERNQVDSRIDVSTMPVSEISDRYDLILANLTGPTLIELSKSISDRLLPDGVLIIAGILEIEGPQVLDTFIKQGLVCQKSLTEEEWIAFRLQKKV